MTDTIANEISARLVGLGVANHFQDSPREHRHSFYLGEECLIIRRFPNNTATLMFCTTDFSWQELLEELEIS